MGLLERALSIEKIANQGQEPVSSLLKRASLLRKLTEEKPIEESPEKKKPSPLKAPQKTKLIRNVQPEEF